MRRYREGMESIKVSKHNFVDLETSNDSRLKALVLNTFRWRRKISS